MSDYANEPHEPLWAIIDSERVVRCNLTLRDAEDELDDLNKKKFNNSYTIVTNDVAARVSGQIENTVLKYE